MTTEKMKCFIDVVKFKSFTKAAQANYITQAAVSQQISSIEEELGFKCFIRTKAGLVITDGGTEFYNCCLRMMSLYSQSISRARCIAHSLSGNISIGLWPGFVQRPVYDVVSNLFQLYQDIRIVVRTGSPVDFWHKIKASKLALAIVMPYDFSDMDVLGEIVEPLFSCRYDLYVSTANPICQFECVCVEQLRNEEIVVAGESGIGGKAYSHTVIEQMQNRYQLKPSHIVSNFETQQMMVAANRGVMLLPQAVIPSDLSLLKRIRLSDYPEKCDFSLVWNPTRASPGLCAFVEELKLKFCDFDKLTNFHSEEHRV